MKFLFIWSMLQGVFNHVLFWFWFKMLENKKEMIERSIVLFCWAGAPLPLDAISEKNHPAHNKNGGTQVPHTENNLYVIPFHSLKSLCREQLPLLCGYLSPYALPPFPKKERGHTLTPKSRSILIAIWERSPNGERYLDRNGQRQYHRYTPFQGLSSLSSALNCFLILFIQETSVLGNVNAHFQSTALNSKWTSPTPKRRFVLGCLISAFALFLLLLLYLTTNQTAQAQGFTTPLPALSVQQLEDNYCTTTKRFFFFV